MEDDAPVIYGLEFQVQHLNVYIDLYVVYFDCTDLICYALHTFMHTTTQGFIHDLSIVVPV